MNLNLLTYLQGCVIIGKGYFRTDAFSNFIFISLNSDIKIKNIKSSDREFDKTHVSSMYGIHVMERICCTVLMINSITAERNDHNGETI